MFLEDYILLGMKFTSWDQLAHPYFFRHKKYDYIIPTSSMSQPGPACQR